VENMREVRFDIWCEKCRYRMRKETHPPCDECLEEGMRCGTEKPTKFEEK